MRLIALLLILLWSFADFRANDVIVFDGSQEILNIGSTIGIYEDTTNSLSVEEIIELDSFTQSNQVIPNLGVSTSTFWIELNIKNVSASNTLLLDVANPLLNEVELYTALEDSNYKVVKTGDALPYSQREFDYQNFLFEINSTVGQEKKYFLKIKSWEQISLSISLGKPSETHKNNQDQDIFFGIYFGIIISLILYNIFIYTTVNDKSYLIYVVYILFVALTQATLNGYPFRLLWPNFPEFSNISLIILPAVTGFAMLRFITLFLKTKEFVPILHKISFIIAGIYIVAIVAVLCGQYHLSFKITDANAGLISLYALIIGISISLKNYRPAKFFLLAWAIFLIGVVVFVLRNAGVLQANNFTNYTMPIGSAMEVILLSFALADKINTYKRERVEALQENERIITEQNVILEQKVTERTGELNTALVNLKSTQSQLVDSEKMASLGQLTAGIAHEINNPINFVSSNIKPLKQDLEDLNAILKKYEEIEPNADINNILTEIEALKKELDYDYLKQELVEIIDGIEDGAKRTTEIVRGLKNFSRLDEGELKKANINDGIESTLTIIKSSLENIVVNKNLEELPVVECYPGKLNQLFMNIINNSCDAIKSRKDLENGGTIDIRSYHNKDADEITISIKDNGIGMDQETKEKIFEPFFTTKDVGQGTGLGMSIAHGIIEAHRGKIDIVSEVGQGTEFMITISCNIDKNG